MIGYNRVPIILEFGMTSVNVTLNTAVQLMKSNSLKSYNVISHSLLAHRVYQSVIFMFILYLV